nr:Nif3-like dinuclear metal center hexameric protein [Bacteroidota bacterium]
MKIKEITSKLEEYAPLGLQEPYDNAGLIIGDPDMEVNKALISLDVTEGIIEEAISNGCDIIVAHHPLIFKGVKKITGRSYVERMIVACIKNNIAVYAIHTNLDNISNGVNRIICDKLGLNNPAILAPKREILRKLVTFCPVNYADKVRTALFDAGAGHIGNYDSCSFNVSGSGSFRALEGANPFTGSVDQLHFEDEVRIESIYPVYLEDRILSTLLKAHPYEEVAYDFYPLNNQFTQTGAGMVGELPKPEKSSDFLNRIKKIFSAGCVRHTKIISETICKVAVCGGSGSFLIGDAIRSGADVLVTGDTKYHEMFDADGKILIADVGHYESEQFTMELLMNVIKNFFPTFAVRNSGVKTNPVFYL